MSLGVGLISENRHLQSRMNFDMVLGLFVVVEVYKMLSYLLSSNELHNCALDFILLHFNEKFLTDQV